MTSEEKLESLNDKVLDKMLKWMDDDETERLPELNVAVTYLAKNSIVAEKRVSTREEEIKQKVEDAKKRRTKQDNES